MGDHAPAGKGSGNASSRHPPRYHLDDSKGDDPQIRQHAPLSDVLEIAAYHAVEVGVVPVGHLPPAGDAGLDGKTLQVALGVLLHLAGQRWAGAHHGHLAQEDVKELRELVDRVLADEAADPGDPGVLPHLEHGAGDLVLFLQLLEALVGVPVHAPELPHAEGGQAAVSVGLPHADLAVEGVALALQANGRREHQARHGYDGEHAPAEADVERPLHEAVAQARAVPVLDALHRPVALRGALAAHGLGEQRGTRRHVIPI